MTIITKPNLVPADLCADFVRRLEAQNLQDGRLTAGPMGQDKKSNLQVVDTPESLAISNEINRFFISDRDLIEQFAIRKSLPFMYNCYREGMHYGPHVDNAIMNFQQTELRCDLSTTVFLCPPDSYDGGELVIGVDDKNPTAIKLPAGGMVIYSANTMHEVRPVTRGTRWAAVTWMQSRIRSREQREIYRFVIRAIRALSPNHAEIGSLADREALSQMLRVKDELLRMWSE